MSFRDIASVNMYLYINIHANWCDITFTSITPLVFSYKTQSTLWIKHSNQVNKPGHISKWTFFGWKQIIYLTPAKIKAYPMICFNTFRAYDELIGHLRVILPGYTKVSYLKNKRSSGWAHWKDDEVYFKNRMNL